MAGRMQRPQRRPRAKGGVVGHKPWSVISQQLAPEQVAAVEAKVARMDRAIKAREEREGTRSTMVRSRTPRPKVVGVALPITPLEVAAWIQAEDAAQPGFAAAVESALTELRRARRRKRT